MIRGWFCCTNNIGYINGIINKTGFVGGEVKIKILIMDYKVRFSIILVKLFLRRYLIYLKLNSLLVAMCSLILNSVYSVGFSFYKVLNNNLGTVVFLYFFTYILLVYKSI